MNVKAIVREIIGPRHWSAISWGKDRFGLIQTVTNYGRLLISHDRIGRAPNPLTGGLVHLRLGTIDQVVYDEIFVNKEYEFPFGDPLVIVDAGAHIGLSSVFFASKYPRATVIAIEPELSNFNVLMMNARKYTNIKPVNAAIWSSRTSVHIENPDAESWSFRVNGNGSGQVIDAISISNVMSEFGLDRIDILKMDIEGSEVEVLSDCDSWLDSVGSLVIELHDRFRPNCSVALERALHNYHYKRFVSGESVIISNLRKQAPIA